jgi:DNA polymerase-3 subunit epsilon/ATP-dependent DNA helicase DinG
VDELLQTQLFAEKQSSILTSATLAIDNSFAFIKERLGLDDLHELQLDSPFDYEQQAMVYIPTDIPEPNQQGYQQKVEETLIRLCAATAGRTLTLFTASNMLKQTYYGIREPLEEHEITVLAQGIDGSRRVLLERFKEWPRSVLLGTSSFWEGVDVVGEALSVLVIARLPFNVPSDPIFAARSERFNDPFLEYSVPQSILRFKQGFGRLIRSREDRGLVVVLDGRLIKKRYGQKFLLSLPATSVRTGTLQQLPSVATRFLDGGRGTGNGG